MREPPCRFYIESTPPGNGKHILCLKFNNRSTKIGVKFNDHYRNRNQYCSLAAVGDTVQFKANCFESLEEAKVAHAIATAAFTPLIWQGPVEKYLNFAASTKLYAQMFQPELVEFELPPIPRQLLSIVRNACTNRLVVANANLAVETAWVLGVWLSDGWS